MKRVLNLVTKVMKGKRLIVSKQAWHTVGGKKIYFRSTWELKFAKHLQFMKEQEIILEWEHEPKTFWFENIKRGVRSYLPDFKITRKDGSHYWAEVKGYMDSKSRTKINRFRKYYPEETLMLYDQEWFRKNRIMPYICG